MNQDDSPPIIYGYMQPTDLFHGEAVADYCTRREQDIQRRIQNMPHRETLSSDKETLITHLIDSYLSDKIMNYPILNIDKANLESSSSTARLQFLYTIPWDGGASYFTFKPTNEFPRPSDEVTIHLDDFRQEITFYYQFTNLENAEQLQSRLQQLLVSDVAWIIDSLDNIISCFRQHEGKLKEIIYRTLEQRIETVASIEQVIGSIEIPEDIFKDKLSVSGAQIPSNQRNPRYNVFRPLLFGQQEGKCAGTSYEIYYSQSTVDHVHPKSGGGANALDNLKVLCESCNNLKDDKSWDEYVSRIKADPTICMGYVEK